MNEVPKILNNGVTGVIVRSEDPDAMAGALMRMAREPELRKQLATNALTEATDKHSIAPVARMYQALYDAPSLDVGNLWRDR